MTQASPERCCWQVVMYLRLVASVYIHENRDFFEPFILVGPRQLPHIDRKQGLISVCV